MLRLPPDILTDIAQRVARGGDARGPGNLSRVCLHLRRVLNTTDSLLRFYLDRRSIAEPVELACYAIATQRRLQHWTRTDNGAQRTVQLMLDCASMCKVVPADKQSAVKAWQASSCGDLAAGVQLLHSVLPYSEHCLLPFFAYGGHVHLMKALLPLTHTPVRFHSMLHYVRTSAFFAAAAGGKAEVLSELLAAGALTWACQLPGVSLTRTALDLAAQGGHLEAMQLLRRHVGQPSSTFLTAAAESGSGPAMEWALGFWFEQFSAVTGFSPAHIQQMHDALRVACQRGHLAVIRQLLRYLHAVRSQDCCVLALSYTCSTSNTAAIRCVLESPYLPQQLQRGGPKLLEQLVMVAASCLRIAIRCHNMASLELLLDALSSSTSPLAPARQLLAPQMPSVFDQAASAGNAVGLQLLLTRLPEHYPAMGLSALEGALSEGHTDLAATIRTLLILRGPEEGFTPQAVSTENNPAVARATRQGAFKAASSRGDVAALQQLLGVGVGVGPEGGGVGPDDNDQLLMIRLAAAGGQEAAVRLLLGEFGGNGHRQELCLRAVCRGAVHAGQAALLKSLEGDLLAGHLASQPDSLAEYMRGALLCGQVEVAAWLVGVAGRQQQLGVVRSTLQSLLTTSRWDLWNTDMGRSAREAVAALLKVLATQPAAPVGAATTADPLQPSSAAAAATASSPTAAEVPAAAAAASAAGAPIIPPAAAALSEQLLNPQVLSLLLQASAGDPTMLYFVVDLVTSWGLNTQQKQPQQQVEEEPQQPEQQQEQAGPVRCSSVALSGLQAVERQLELATFSKSTRGSSGSSLTVASSSYTTIASSSSSSFGSIGGSPLSSHPGACCSSCPDSQACSSSSWPMVLGCGKSSGGGCDTVWIDQASPQTDALHWLHRADGVVNVIGSPCVSKEKLQVGSVKQPAALLKPASPRHPSEPIREGAGSSLRQLTGRVEQLSVSSPSRLLQQQQQQSLRRESQPVQPTQGLLQPLRTAVSLPMPRANHQPQHPYMMQYHQQRKQQQEGPLSAGAAAGSVDG